MVRSIHALRRYHRLVGDGGVLNGSFDAHSKDVSDERGEKRENERDRVAHSCAASFDLSVRLGAVRSHSLSTVR